MVPAAGSYGSPAVLLRSGIGPAADLAAFGIPVVADRPGVVANLIDHANVGCGIEPVQLGQERPQPFGHDVVLALAAGRNLLRLA